LISRRTLRRHYLFRPDCEVRQIFVYLLAVNAERYGIDVHSFCLMSTHLHLVVTDTRGVLPDFLRDFHRLLALATKALRKWDGCAFDDAPTSAVLLTTPQAVIDKIGYVLANPVKAGLVRYARDWPGAKSHPNDLAGGSMTATRPDKYLDPDHWPDTARLELARPADVDAEDTDHWRSAVKNAITEHERHARAEVAEKGWKFLGAHRAQRISPYERATSFEPLRDRNPTFAVGGVVGAYRAAVKALREFRRAYDDAVGRWREGFREVVFPAGTWWMVQWHAALVEPPPT
jgi:putative transposase